MGGPTTMGMIETPAVARIAVCGWTYWQGQLDNRKEARSMLVDAFTSSSWTGSVATITITPGGFVRTRLPRDYSGNRGWNSEDRDLPELIPHAEAVVKDVMRGDILDLTRRRTRFLTLGVDLNVERHKEERIQNDHRCGVGCPFSCTHAELVAVIDSSSGEVVRWTGKSHPVGGQQHTLVHVTDFQSHFLDIGSERLLVLGCHDLYLFIDRGRKSLHGPTPKEVRKERMRQLADKFEPTMILHHPHFTYSPSVWSSPWGATRSMLPTARVWASGIAFCGNPKPKGCWGRRQTLDATLAATASRTGVLDVVINGCGT